MSDVPMIETLINGRWTLALPEHRAARPQWMTGWETERLASMAANLGPGDRIVDVGAEEGDLPALWALWGAEVALVEPNPRVWPNIRAIFEANALESRLAVGGCWVGFAGDRDDYDRPDWSAEHVGARTKRWPTCAYGPVIGDHGFLVLPERPDVPVITLDRFCQLWHPTAITIDVEGAELTVLRGARRLLTEDRPIVWVSIHVDMPWIDEKYPGDTQEAVEEYMGGLGYVNRHIATDHERHEVFWHPEGRHPVSGET